MTPRSPGRAPTKTTPTSRCRSASRRRRTRCASSPARSSQRSTNERTPVCSEHARATTLEQQVGLEPPAARHFAVCPDTRCASLPGLPGHGPRVSGRRARRRSERGGGVSDSNTGAESLQPYYYGSIVCSCPEGTLQSNSPSRSTQTFTQRCSMPPQRKERAYRLGWQRQRDALCSCGTG